MVFLRNKNKMIVMLFNIIAVVSTIIFGSIASTSIYQIIVDNAVFMTAIHKVFLNPLFLISGGYLGIYIIYRLMILTLDER
ncbi:transposase [Viridibacillus sp. FSL H8-0123]|nr:transposase [Viridibacillus sp. FSL H8-0123]OMC85894.1 transposase [Viridibacillus sp. FSL H7-0596]OMC92019.1 transposase [Viridibacillus arenosi]